ncbi:MAG: MerR family transcriptional regulator [Fuerstiella sp.]
MTTFDGSEENKLASMPEAKDFPDLTNVNLVSSPPLANECVAFTGTLASMVHREASELVETYGGRAVQSVSRAVTMLVIGEEGWPLEEDGETSQKLIHATELIGEGAEIRIVPESDWLHLIGLNERRDEIQRSYTPAMLSRLLDVPVGMIRRWARIGLIRPVRKVCRLPYFDYREVASAQRLAKLLDEGVRAEVLEKSLAELSSTLVGTDRSLAQLNLLVQDEKVVLRDAHGMLNPRTGQRLLDFDSTPSIGLHCQEPSETEQQIAHPLASVPELPNDDGDDDMPISFSLAEARMRLDDRDLNDWSAEDWFQEGCRLSEESAFDSAVNAFRNCLSLLATDNLLRSPGEFPAADPIAMSPDPADVHFHLADALYRAGKADAAIERYHGAIEFAPDFIEAWTQLGCLQAERGHLVPAEEALLTAISIHDSNPDALLHYAQLLDQMKRTVDAEAYWRRYLEHDSRGPWADHARTRLEEANVSASQDVK